MKYPWKFRKVCSGNPSGNTNKHSSLITRVSLADSRVFNPQMVCQRWLSPCFHSVSLRLVTNIKKKFDIPQRDLAPCMPCMLYCVTSEGFFSGVLAYLQCRIQTPTLGFGFQTQWLQYTMQKFSHYMKSDSDSDPNCQLQESESESVSRDVNEPHAR